MLKLFYSYLLSLPVMFAFDGLWLGFIAKDFYFTQLSEYLATPFNMVAGGLFYLIYVVGILIFAVYPGVTEGNLPKTLILAAIFGFMCYMTYDLTNLATVRNWPLTLSFVDMAWGTVLSTFTAYVMYTIYFWIK